MGHVIFTVEPETRGGGRWCIKRSGSVRATYSTRAQAVMDARQLAAFENELRGQSALVRVLDVRREIAEDLVYEGLRFARAVVPEPKLAVG